MPTMSDVNHWPHLQDIHLPEIDTDIGLLIRINVPYAYSLKEIRTGPRGSPHATRTPIGRILCNVLRQADGSSSYPVSRIEIKGFEVLEDHGRLERLVRRSVDMDFPERLSDEKKENSVLWATVKICYIE